MTTRVLFLYISSSSGHQRAADAAREALATLNPTWETVGIDAFSYAYPTIGKIVSRTYLEILRYTPILWDLVYDNPDVEEATREVRDLLNLISVPKMRSLLKKHNPQALVCTQAVPCSLFAAEKRRGHLAIPLIAVMTDFALHAYWVHPEVDLYCVATEEERRYLIQQGLPATQIAVTGIPISPDFLRHTPSVQAREKLGLDPKSPTLLVMGGSQGLGPIQEMVDRLHAASVQCIVSTGLNRETYRALQKRYGRDRSIRLFGYTRHISELMDAADLLVTKPGGLTSSEALAKGLPILIVNPIPGQEERNARFLIKAGVAEQASDSMEIARVAETLLHHPTRLKKMAENARNIARPYAAMEVARQISRLIRSI